MDRNEPASLNIDEASLPKGIQVQVQEGPCQIYRTQYEKLFLATLNVDHDAPEGVHIVTFIGNMDEFDFKISLELAIRR